MDFIGKATLRVASPSRVLVLGAILALNGQGSALAAPAVGEVDASSSTAGFAPKGAVDGDRFSTESDAAWKGRKGDKTWWWQVRYPEPRAIGAILQINGDHPTVLRNAPRRYVWRWSSDGVIWHNLRETETLCERRLFRIHRLNEPVRAQYLRLQIFEADGEFPTLREAEFYDQPAAAISFPDWIVAVSTAEESTLPAAGQRFIGLAKACKDWQGLPAQEVWLGSFDEAFVAAEPRPLCAFLTGNIPEWCQRMQEPWRGTQEVLKKRNLPIWAACGGAQGLAILDDIGMKRPWDCPRCRDPKDPLLPIYTHIGHTGPAVCGDYSKNVFERGKFNVRQSARDPAFAGLPQEFEIMESHCGQIEYVPKGWLLVVTRGQGAKTKNQCLRVKDRYIYAAQFHMENEGTPDNSRTIMSNFLKLAKEWGGYNPRGKDVAAPEVLPESTP
jgi:hypothetical protein